MNEFHELAEKLLYARQENEISEEKQTIKNMEIYILSQKDTTPYREVYAFIDAYHIQLFSLDQDNIDAEYRKKMIPLVNHIIQAAAKVNT